MKQQTLPWFVATSVAAPNWVVSEGDVVLSLAGRPLRAMTLDVSGASRVQRPVGGSLNHVPVDPTRWVALVARTSTAMVALESATKGLIGGILGLSAGLLVVVGMAAGQTWTPVIDPVTTLLAPLPGGLVGLLTGLYPALRGARLEPVEALRSGACA